MGVEKAVILARGLGTRMQRPSKNLRLRPDVMRFAEKGWKAFIPIRGKPLLDYTINSLQLAAPEGQHPSAVLGESNCFMLLK